MPKKILLVEPAYYTRYPPLGLLKLATYHRELGDKVKLVRGTCDTGNFKPNEIKVTSLFTYSWKPVHEAVQFYKDKFPRAPICLGGIYATLMPEHAALSGADEIHAGPVPDAEYVLPAYDLIEDESWDAGLGFASRGCIRKCPFCAVPRMEPEIVETGNLSHILIEGQKKIILWDNNILGTSLWREVIAEIKQKNLIVDFNQAMDARLVTEEVAEALKGVRLRPIRMAYDTKAQGPALERASALLENAGFRRDKMIVYTLYNFTETPQTFFERVKELLLLGLVPYPMRYEPLDSLKKNQYVSPHWTARELEQVSLARRVLGTHGAFPPYEGLRLKFEAATTFAEGFDVRHRDDKKMPDVDGRLRRWMTPIYTNGNGASVEYAKPMNDPMRLADPARCQRCDLTLTTGTAAFMIVGQEGSCLGYICPNCHSNRKWIWALWRNTLTFDPAPVTSNQSKTVTVNLNLGKPIKRLERSRMSL